MSEAVLSLLDAVNSSKEHHQIGFYGKDELPERYINRCRELEIKHQVFKKASGVGASSWMSMLAWLRDYRPDVVISHMTQPLPALLAYRLFNRKATLVIVEHHSNDLKSFKDWFLTLTNHWFCDRTVYLTAEYENQVSRKLGLLYRKAKVSVIGNAINTDLFSPATTTDNGSFTIGMQARMVEGKDFETLFKAFEILRHESPGLSLEIAGDGPDRPRLERLVSELGIEKDVVFLGMMEQSDLAERMKSWHVLVLATSGETMSRAVMEGQALGLVVVATDVGGTKATIRDNVNGMLVPPKAPKQLAEKLLFLRRTPELRATISRNAREMALSEFSPISRWEQFSLLISQTLARK